MSKVGDSESKNTLYCSFCGKSQREVRKLIAGPTVFICDECVELCMDIIREEKTSSLTKSRKAICKVPYEEILKAVASAAGIKPMLIRVPFTVWHALAWIAEMLPRPPITRNQVELMQVDSVSSPDIPGLGELGISPHSIEEILQGILWEH